VAKADELDVGPWLGRTEKASRPSASTARRPPPQVEHHRTHGQGSSLSLLLPAATAAAVAVRRIGRSGPSWQSFTIERVSSVHLCLCASVPLLLL